MDPFSFKRRGQKKKWKLGNGPCCDLTGSVSDYIDCMDTSGAINRFQTSKDAVLIDDESLVYSRLVRIFFAKWIQQN